MRQLLTTLFIFCSITAISQNMLTLDEAISSAVENNYSIKISKAREAQAQNDNTRGNAGMLPTITGNGQKVYNLANINQVFFPSNGTVRDPLNLTGVNTNNSNTNLAMVWTVFDGMGMFATAARLQEIEKLGKTNVKIAIENTVAQICGAYYDIIRQKQRLKALTNALDISKTRRELAKANYEVGTSSKSDYLAAQVDFNQDEAALVGQEQNLQNAKVNLNAQMLRDLAIAFNVSDTIVFNENLAISQLRQNVIVKNPNLTALELNKQIATLAEKETRSLKMPQLDLIGGLAYTTSANNAASGFGVQSGDNTALNYGARVSINIFDGYNQKRREQNAKINTTITTFQIADLKNQLQSFLERTFNVYQNSLKLYGLEEQNLKIARQNVGLAFERYKFGNSTAIEFREAQRNAVATESRLIEAAFNVKIAEIELLRLSSSIVEEVR
jgi:outer membrane protein